MHFAAQVGSPLVCNTGIMPMSLALFTPYFRKQIALWLKKNHFGSVTCQYKSIDIMSEQLSGFSQSKQAHVTNT